jgi:hypothetical protein
MMFVATYFLASFFIMFYAFVKDKEKMRIRPNAINKFIGLMVFISMVRLCSLSRGLIRSPDFPLSMANFIIVFFEDAFYVMIPYYICKKIDSKLIKLAIWYVFSLWFASGHLYQGMFVAMLTGLYPYFISRYYAKKTSFTTVMVCHFLFDCFTFLTIKFHKLLIYV